MKTSLWRGSKEITESPDSPKWDFQINIISCVRTFYGPYATCLAKKPSYNQKMADLGADSGLYVTNVKVNKQKGGKGEMIVTLESLLIISSGETGQPPKYEREWSQVDRKLEAHPRYTLGGLCVLSTQDLVQIGKWEDEKNGDLRAVGKFTDIGGTQTLSANAQDFAYRRLKGQDSYSQWVPILRKTKLWLGAPPATKCGIRLTRSLLPTDVQFIAPDGYIWMKTADRSNQTGIHGRTERAEEWTGFDKVDADIYA